MLQPLTLSLTFLLLLKLCYLSFSLSIVTLDANILFDELRQEVILECTYYS